jgi:hypothetical protein
VIANPGAEAGARDSTKTSFPLAAACTHLGCVVSQAASKAAATTAAAMTAAAALPAAIWQLFQRWRWLKRAAQVMHSSWRARSVIGSPGGHSLGAQLLPLWCVRLPLRRVRLPLPQLENGELAAARSKLVSWPFPPCFIFVTIQISSCVASINHDREASEDAVFALRELTRRVTRGKNQ